MRTKLKRLFLSGFRSFVDDTVIDFDDTGLWLLQGVSGSGKSSIFVAIAYALGYAPYPATELLSWGGVATLKVELTLDTPQGEVRVRRAPPSFVLWVAGEQVRGGAKACEERLTSILGASPEILALLTYRQQRTPGLFLSQSDSDKKELLTGLLGLDKFERAIDNSQVALKALEDSLKVVTTRLDVAQGQLADSADNPDPEVLREKIQFVEKDILTACTRGEHFKSKIQACKDQRKQEVQAAFDVFNPQIAQARDDLAGILKPAVEFDDRETVRLTGLVTTAAGRIATLSKDDEAKQKEDKAKRQAIHTQILSERQTFAQFVGLQKERERLTNELKSINDDNCPTCERPWEHATVHKASLAAKIREVSAQLNICYLAEAEEKKLQLSLTFFPDFVPNPLIAKLQEAKTKAEEQLKSEQARKRLEEAAVESAYREQQAIANSVLAQLQADQQVAYRDAAKIPFPELEASELALEEEKKIEQRARTEHALLKQQLSHAVQAHAAKEAAQKRLADLQEEQKTVSTQLNAEKDFLGLVDRTGFLGAVVEEVLQEISDEVNTILGAIANTNRITLEFKSESTTAKGVTKRSITPVVTVGGNVAGSLKSALSGGMLSSLELCVDLALGAVVSRRSGATPGWLVLDESFDGLDSTSLESILEILTHFSRDRLVLLTDHDSSFQSMFQKTLFVKCVEGKSTISFDRIAYV